MFGEFEEMVLYHAVLLKVMLGLLVIGMIIPFIGKLCSATIKRMRIYMFVSHGLLTMIAFTGLVAMIFAKIPLNMDIIAMIGAFFVLIGLEVIKYKKMLKTREDRENCSSTMKKVAITVTLIEIAIIAVLVVYKIMEAKSAIPVS